MKMNIVNWNKIIAMLEIAGGALGTAKAVAIISANSLEVTPMSYLFLILYVLSFIAGLLLWKGHPLGISLSLPVQAFQIPQFNVNDLSYRFMDGLELTLHLGFKGESNFDFTIGSNWNFSVFPQEEPFWIGLNIAAGIILVYLYKRHTIVSPVTPRLVIWIVAFLIVFLLGSIAYIEITKEESGLVISERLIVKIDPSSWIQESSKVSPDSKRVTYVAREGNKLFAVVDREEGKKYDDIMKGTPVFSPDSKRIAYAAQMGNKWLVVIDGREEQQYDFVYNPIFSPDNKRVACVAQVGNKVFVVVDREEGKKYDDIMKGTPVFSPDSKRIAYAAQMGNKWLVVIDGREEKQYDNMNASSLLFSPDSEHVAYAAQEGNKWFYVVDGKEEKHYDGIGPLIFSPDRKRIVYVADEGNKSFVVVDGKEEKHYDGIGKTSPIFSHNSMRLAYVAMEGIKQFVIVDGIEEKQYDGIMMGGPIFSPDSKRVAYVAQERNKRFVVVDDIISKIVFDSRYSLLPCSKR